MSTHKEVIKILENNKTSLLSYAVKPKCRPMFDWLISSERKHLQLTPDQLTLDKAASAGNQLLVEWLTSPQRGNLRLSPGDNTLYSAVQSGNRSLIRWMLSSDSRYFSYPTATDRYIYHKNLISQTALNGDQWLVEWLMSSERGDLQVDPTRKTLDSAARSGNLSLVQWLISRDRGVQRVSPGINTLIEAAKKPENLAVLEWLTHPEREEARVRPKQSVFVAAINWGNLEVVEWLMSPDRQKARIFPTVETVCEAWQSLHGLPVIEYLISPARGQYQMIPTMNMVNISKKIGLPYTAQYFIELTNAQYTENVSVLLWQGMQLPKREINPPKYCGFRKVPFEILVKVAGFFQPRQGEIKDAEKIAAQCLNKR
jgi:hypothetical protein